MTTDRQMREALAARFPAELERQFSGRGGRTFTYVPDESVMDRLDDVIGIGGWSIGVDPMGDRCVRVTLRVGMAGAAGNAWVDYQDFGYSNNPDSAEPLKEASGDGLRRCARYIGIARYLYAGDVRPQPVQNGPGRPEPTRVASVSSGVPFMGVDPHGTDAGDAWPDELPQTPAGRMAAEPILPMREDICEEHNLPWKGERFDLYHRMPEGGYHRHAKNTPRAAVR